MATIQLIGSVKRLKSGRAIALLPDRAGRSHAAFLKKGRSYFSCARMQSERQSLKNMATITLQIPDELAQRLEPLQNRLPELLLQLLELTKKPTTIEPEITTHSGDIPTVYQEVLDFLIKSPIPQDIVNFKVSQQAQTRLQILLDKNRESTLDPMEIAELDVYEQLEHLMILLKARAYSAI
ncbi:hypothetical protein QUB70_25230 [Microcoleus sp. A003_D6]|uniref:hypothetical protein n=1 Tax=Microcoleus sp. A003_D6 TaxID=3055266 RepID=UPI002FD60135